jgi:ABC-type lipopolysaccharide export system ATPase subunit
MQTLIADSILLEFGARPILRDVYLQVPQSTVAGLLGRNGSGKSCLLQIIYGTLSPACKMVRIGAQHLPEAFTRPDLIRCLPQFQFLPASWRISEVFDLFGLPLSRFQEFAPEHDWPARLRVGMLSGGQKRLLECWLLIRSDSNFVLLDEPFTHLMPLQVEKIKDLIRAEKTSKGFIISDHMYRHVLELSDQLYVMADLKLHLVQGESDLQALGYIR